MTFDDYQTTAAFFAKARKPEAGKPISQKGWRLFKDGDEFVFNYLSLQVARLLPNETVRMVYSGGDLPQGVVHTVNRVLPLAVIRRSKAHYRVHAKKPGSGTGYMTASSWGEFTKGGYRLYDGLTFSLRHRMPVTYKEPAVVTDPGLRKEWLRDLKNLKAHLNTVARVGGFTARVDAMRATGRDRWDVMPLLDVDLPIMLAALGGDTEAFVQRLADLMFRDFHRTPSASEQYTFACRIIERRSYDLRAARGVITVR